MAAMHRLSPHRLGRALRLLPLAAAVLLGGCVAYPGYGYDYGYAPYYGYPAGGIAVVGGGWGDRWHDGRWPHGSWHGNEWHHGGEWHHSGEWHHGGGRHDEAWHHGG